MEAVVWWWRTTLRLCFRTLTVTHPWSIKFPKIRWRPTKEQISKLSIDHWPLTIDRWFPNAHTFGHTCVPGGLSQVMSKIPLPNLMIDHPLSVLDQLPIRITRRNNMGEGFSPSLEGVHQDNTQMPGSLGSFLAKTKIFTLCIYYFLFPYSGFCPIYN